MHEKRYKLIKEFPGSPKVGHVIKEYSNTGHKNFYHSESEDEDSIDLRMYPGWYVVNYPEYWEKINN